MHVSDTLCKRCITYEMDKHKIIIFDGHISEGNPRMERRVGKTATLMIFIMHFSPIYDTIM